MCECKRSYVREVPDVVFIMSCGVLVFDLFYCRLDLCCGECYVGCLQFECFPIYVSVCFVCFMFDCVGELFDVVCDEFNNCVWDVCLV